MEFVVWVETRLAGRTLEVREVAKIERDAAGIRPEELGLTLANGKAVLKQVQARMVQTQVEVISAAARVCMHCGRNQCVKDLRSRRLGTVFGAVDVFCRRYVWCHCRAGRSRAEWPLRRMEPERTTHVRRHGRRVSSAPAESGMSHLVNQRMGKRQPMSWSLEGAHLLLQVRCAMLDERLETLFREWHPRFRQMPAATELPAM